MSGNPPSIPLSPENLARLAVRVQVPAYDRDAVTRSIVHIGVGGFFRAHQALYLDELLHRPGHSAWGYCGVGLLPRDASMRDALRPQGGLYTLVERSAQGDRARVVGSLLEYLHAPQNAAAVLEKLAAPETRIVSLTITEGGYYIDEASGEFNDTHPDIVRDLDNPRSPRCSFGFLVEALVRRRERKLEPFTILSCDNLQHNGDVARRMLLAFAERREPDLAVWMRERCTFPNSMVDRITPATTDAHRALVRERYGIEDHWPVVSKPFKQWVIEDRFPLGRPAWETVGAQMTAEVAPYEKMKLRLLNASHQAMCYIGMLLGYRFAHEAIANPHIHALVRDMMKFELSPLLTAPVGIDLDEYQAALLERFANPAIGDHLARIGTDGSARIPGFVLPSIVDALERGAPMARLCFTVAAWLRYLSAEDDAGHALPFDDKAAAHLQTCARRRWSGPDDVMQRDTVFGADLLQRPSFVRAIRDTLSSLYDKGAAAALAGCVEG